MLPSEELTCQSQTCHSNGNDHSAMTAHVVQFRAKHVLIACVSPKDAAVVAHRPASLMMVRHSAEQPSSSLVNDMSVVN